MNLRRHALSAAVLALALSLTGCGSSKGADPKDDTKASTATSDSPSASPSESPSDAPAGAYKAAAWAAPISSKGEKLGTIKGKGFSVDVFQVAKGKAEEDSMFVDRDTKKNLMPKGTPTVFVNFVVTNTGSEPIPLASLLVDIDGKYEDWKYMGGMPGEAHSDVFEGLGLTNRGIKVGEDKPYTLAPGESYNKAESYFYQGPKKLLLEVGLTPAKADGDLDHDKKVEAEGSVTLK